MVKIALVIQARDARSRNATSDEHALLPGPCGMTTAAAGATT